MTVCICAIPVRQRRNLLAVPLSGAQNDFESIHCTPGVFRSKTDSNVQETCCIKNK